MQDVYDVIVIGAGHNGLSLAAQLAARGLRTLVLEKDQSVGGMARSSDDLLAGFVHHQHANYLSYLDFDPTKGLDLEALGVDTVWPEAQHGICFRNDQPPLILYRPDRIERSRRSIARYSTKDARTFVRVKSRADRLRSSLERALFSQPSHEVLDRQRNDVSTAFADCRFQTELGTGSAQSIIDGLFESPELRTLLYRLSLEFGVGLSEPGGDVGFLGYVLLMLGRRRLPVGGMSRVPMALKELIERHGGRVQCAAAVKRVMIENGRAAGVVLEGGRTIAATTCIAVASSVDALYTELVPPEHFPRRRRPGLIQFRAARATSVGSSEFCLREPPRYRAATFDPDIDTCLMTFIGLDTPEEVLAAASDIGAGLLPPPAAVVRVNTLWDRAQAPQGAHAAGADSLFPSLRSFDAETLTAITETYADALLEIWSTYAPNMTKANVLAQRCSLSPESERKLLLMAGDEQFRSGIDRLYLCGAETYPGGGVHGSCAHNAMRVISKDCGLVV